MKNKEVNPTKQHSMKCPKLYGKKCTCDGYHTFDELYNHRIALFITLCNYIYKMYGKLPDSARGDMIPWKSKNHHKGGEPIYDGWFIAGIGFDKGKQISYHLPIKDWDKLRVVTYDNAPEWDGHTPDDVIERLLKL